MSTHTVAATINTMSFRFKQFFVEDNRCAMKVGTDGVLLGAWSPIGFRSPESGIRILDIGTGSGLIARMLMQRCPEAKVEGIDIDEAAVEQATENGVNAFCSRLQDWQGGPYDLIVSNPPYFQNSLKNPDKGRQTARHTDTLSYEELIKHSARLLAENGQLALILPAETEEEIIRIAASHGFTLTHITRVFSKTDKPARRVMMAFEKWKMENGKWKMNDGKWKMGNGKWKMEEDTLILEDEKGGRSAAYQELTKDFYL